MRVASLLMLVSVIGTGYSGAPGTSGSLDEPAIKEQLEKEAKVSGYDPRLSPTRRFRRFQRAFLLYPSGEIDVPTHSKFSEYRCANRDMYNGNPLKDLSKKELWKKSILLWNVTSFPSSLSISQTREACDEAFEKWREVAGIEFVETKNASKADIIISFGDLPEIFTNAGATRPLKSRIILGKDQIWGYRNHIPRGISLFHTLLHEIGHTLGLRHNFFRGSIMYPILKPALVPYGTLAGVPNIDKLSLRKLYGRIVLHLMSEIQKLLNVYHVRDRKFIDDGRKIQDVFPRGPGFVNATVSSDNLVLLFAERAIYGYEYDGVTFLEAPGFPRELHGRVLFYPQAAFPLNNGSVILLSGNVFAIYNVHENAPSFLNDKTRYFPNLPDDLRSGVPKDIRSVEAYWMFDENTVLIDKSILVLSSIDLSINTDII
ncbi:unnamed protein product [Heligmosomoides polygyrus]|uniref:ZnMc domain-containing protein n=1 Tax=Heligmosomoides polygyrus TaxID=6339 RepID=A0A3P7WNY1_HELPZ|nr:unnamed protein product [Heligmosomoides polygyrus]